MTYFAIHRFRALLLPLLLLAGAAAILAQSMALTAIGPPILLMVDQPRDAYEVCIFNPNEFTITKEVAWERSSQSRPGGSVIEFRLGPYEVGCEVFEPDSAGVLRELPAEPADGRLGGSTASDSEHGGGIYNNLGDLSVTSVWLLASDGSRQASVQRRQTFWAYTYTSYNQSSSR